MISSTYIWAQRNNGLAVPVGQSVELCSRVAPDSDTQ